MIWIKHYVHGIDKFSSQGWASGMDNLCVQGEQLV